MPSFYAIVIDRALSGLRHALAEFAGFKPGDRALDVCCGTGDQAVHLARMGADAYGIDLDPEMIAVAEMRRRRYGKDNLRFRVADAAAMPFGNGEFDCAAISLALHEKPFDLQRDVVREMRRVTKPGGMLVLADFSVPAGRLYSFVERMVGGEHYACFKAYQESGGLEHLVSEVGGTIEERGTALSGGMQLIKIRN